jgi:hypothetical protein
VAEAWVGPDEVAFPANHSMRGNRVRSRRGVTPVVADVRWREGLPALMAGLVQVFTAPVRRLLARTGDGFAGPTTR